MAPTVGNAGCHAPAATIALWHGTFVVNSLAHVFGRRRYATADTSRNSFLIAVLTMGEGWHNNHHHYQASARQSFRWWEWDPSFYVLWLLERVGIVRDMKRPSERIKVSNLLAAGHADVGLSQVAALREATRGRRPVEA